MNGDGAQALFWWWPAADGCHHVAVLMSSALFVTEPLTQLALQELEGARQAGDIRPEHLGNAPTVIPLDLIEGLVLTEDNPEVLRFSLRTQKVEVSAPRSILEGIHAQLAPSQNPTLTSSWVNGLSEAPFSPGGDATPW